ncbi:MAG: hypothetical protein ABIK82_18580 [Pseudomonadota bacterium]
MRQSDLSDRLPRDADRRRKQDHPGLGCTVIGVGERRQVTWGVYLSRLADWLEEEQTGQRRLAL